MTSENANAKAPNAADTIDTLEATEGLLGAMMDRAEAFPITSCSEAANALVEATVSTSAIVGALLALSDAESERARATLLNCSKEASSATMNILRVLGYLTARTIWARRSSDERA